MASAVIERSPLKRGNLPQSLVRPGSHSAVVESLEPGRLVQRHRTKDLGNGGIRLGLVHNAVQRVGFVQLAQGEQAVRSVRCFDEMREDGVSLFGGSGVLGRLGEEFRSKLFHLGFVVHYVVFFLERCKLGHVLREAAVRVSKLRAKVLHTLLAALSVPALSDVFDVSIVEVSAEVA